MKTKNLIIKKLEQGLAEMAKKSASIEANTACAFWGYQPKEPHEVAKLRKF